MNPSASRRTQAVEFMRIEITAQGDAVSARTRAYAEYRLFAKLARHSRRIDKVCLKVGSQDTAGNGGITCEVDVSLQGFGSARVSTQGPHAHAAIDRAADSIASVIDRLQASNGDSV